MAQKIITVKLNQPAVLQLFINARNLNLVIIIALVGLVTYFTPTLEYRVRFSLVAISVAVVLVLKNYKYDNQTTSSIFIHFCKYLLRNHHVRF